MREGDKFHAGEGECTCQKPPLHVSLGAPSGNIPFTSLAQVLGRGVCKGAGRDDFGLNLRCERMTSFKLYFSFRVPMALTSKLT